MTQMRLLNAYIVNKIQHNCIGLTEILIQKNQLKIQKAQQEIDKRKKRSAKQLDYLFLEIPSCNW